MLTPAPVNTITGDLGGKKIAMGFHEGSLAHLQSIFIDMYSDPVMAVIREYSVNALDSNREAGNPAPIEVFTPSALSPYFRVVDRGIGLSVDDFVNMFSQYGASTKRGSNTQVGMLGIGAKSGLSLAPSFNIISHKDGIKITVLVSRAADGSGMMEVIDTRGTTEPNGVEVRIPVTDRVNFLSKANDFFRFWEPGTVLLNGKAPALIAGKKVGSKFIIDKNLPQDYVVMGNIPYPVKDGLYDVGAFYYNNMGIVARVEIGDVNFTPSREDLHYTAQTKATIAKLKKEFAAELRASAQADIDAAKTPAEAWKSAVEWRNTSRVSDLVYRGVTIPVTGVNTVRAKTWTLASGHGSRSASWTGSVLPKQAADHIILLNAPDTFKLSPLQKDKIKLYCQNKGISAHKAILSFTSHLAEDATHEAFLDEFVKVEWADINAIKISRAGYTRNVRTDPYDLYVDGYTKTQVSTLDTTKPICYFSTADYGDRRSGMDKVVEPGTQIVVLSKNRWEKFKRDFPTAVMYSTAVDNYRNSLLSQFTWEDKVLWHGSNYYGASLLYKHASKIDDPELRKFLTALGGSFSPAATTLRNTDRYAHVPRIEDPLTRYPLASNLRGVSTDHIIWYLNTWHSHLTNSASE